MALTTIAEAYLGHYSKLTWIDVCADGCIAFNTIFLDNSIYVHSRAI